MRLVVVAALLLAGCGEDDPRCDVAVAKLYSPSGPNAFQVPASVPANAPFIVRVTTSGGGCIEFDSTDVSSGPDGAVITPYDRYCKPLEMAACVLVLVPIEHEAMVEFSTTGTKTIRIRTRHQLSVGGGETVDELVDTPFLVELQ